MYLLSALGVESVADVDGNRPLVIGSLNLGVEASMEAFRILEGGQFPSDAEITAHRFDRPTYWSVHHQTDGEGEIFGFPVGEPAVWPTALEVAIIRALAAAPPKDHAQILAGDCCISLGPIGALRDFQKIALLEKRPVLGGSILSEKSSRVSVREGVDSKLNSIILSCFENSLIASPLKFRFLELYRIIEARLMADVKESLGSGPIDLRRAI